MTEWIQWTGGECPIPDAKAGEYTAECNAGFYSLGPAKDLNWQNRSCYNSVIAYRLIEKEQSDLDWLEGEVWEMLNNLPEQDPLSGTARAVALHEVITLIKQRREAKS
jgi:hypothetical protein